MANKIHIVRGDSWAALLQEELGQSSLSVPEWMEEHTKIIKSGTDNLSGLLRLDDEVCFLKFYPFKSFLHRILFSLGFAQPLRNYHAKRELGAQGVAVPRPLACLRVAGGILLMIEGLSGARNLLEAWRRGLADEDALCMMRSAGVTLGTFHQAGYALGSCTWDNLLWDGFRVWLIDLDGSRKSAAGSAAQAQDLAQFTANAEDLEIGAQNYTPFLDAYLQGVNRSRHDVTRRMQPFLMELRDLNLVGDKQRGHRLV